MGGRVPGGETVVSVAGVAHEQSGSSIMAKKQQSNCETLHKDISAAMPAISLNHGYFQKRGNSSSGQN